MIDIAGEKQKQEFASIEELLKRKEELDSELALYQDKVDNGWTVIKHPLVFSVPHFEHANAMVNQQLRYKQEAIQKAVDIKDWSKYIWLHERPYRMEAFTQIDSDMSDQEFWENLSSVWTDSENLWQVQQLLDLHLASDRKGREFMMDDDERDMLEHLPDTFRIYRGHHGINKSGFSWTLSYHRACWFAQRFDQHGRGRVSWADCRKSDVIALLKGRGELEIAVHPKNLDIKNIRPLRHRSQWIKQLREEALSVFKLDKLSFHGPFHWDKVERNAIALGKLVKKADMRVCRLFAMLHDICRVNENNDEDHGERAGEWVRSKADFLKENGVDEIQIDTLVYACRNHEKGMVNTDPTVGVCWDSDRLDLSRVGTIPDPELLCTEAAKSLVWKI